MPLPKPIRDQLQWPESTASRHLLLRVMGRGVIKILSPLVTDETKAHWSELAQSTEDGAASQLAREQFPFFEVRYEREGSRVALTIPILVAMNLPTDVELDQPLYANATPDDGVVLWTPEAFTARATADPI